MSTTALLDINDSNLQLWHGDTHLQSPGYALLDGNSYLFGRAAREVARLRPREINTRYWWQLSTEPLQPAMGPARHTADLVHAHLQALHREGGQPGEVVLAVSGSMQREQLSLLLGIVQQCPFDAVGLVNRSVALASLYSGGGRLFHLEIQLHQAVISQLDTSASTVDLERTVPLPGCGLLQLQERLVEIIAAAFIRQTRFDPRRKAASEQALYDALPGALRNLELAAETSLEINGYRARVSAGELREAGRSLFDSAREAMGVLRPDDSFLADPLAGLLPGLGEHFEQLELLQPSALREALEHHRERLVEREQALSFVTSLPCLALQLAPRGGALAQPAPAPQPAAPRPAEPQPAAPEPTHLLRGARAEPLVATGTPLADGWVLLRAEDGWRLRGEGAAPVVNGAAHTPGQHLSCGDRIRLGAQHEVVLIEVAG